LGVVPRKERQRLEPGRKPSGCHSSRRAASAEGGEKMTDDKAAPILDFRFSRAGGRLGA
jgi:hypothetical protein